MTERPAPVPAYRPIGDVTLRLCAEFDELPLVDVFVAVSDARHLLSELGADPSDPELVEALSREQLKAA